MSATPAPLPTWAGDGRKRILVLSSTPRREGNSRRLAEALIEGATETGHEALLVDLNEHVASMLKDCRKCRSPDGACSIDDNHGRILLDLYLPSDVVVYATPIWWYGISAQLKAFIDRIFCNIADSFPEAERVVDEIRAKRVALLLSAEENNFSARLAIIQQISELCRYLEQDFVGVVVGLGNKRSEVFADPAEPIEAARAVGRRLPELRNTDYKLTTVRPKVVWGEGDRPYPTYWR